MRTVFIHFIASEIESDTITIELLKITSFL